MLLLAGTRHAAWQVRHTCLCGTQSEGSTEIVLATKRDLIGVRAFGLSMNNAQRWEIAQVRKSRWPDWSWGLASWTMHGLQGVWDRILSFLSFSREGCMSLKMWWKDKNKLVTWSQRVNIIECQAASVGNMQGVFGVVAETHT